MRNFNCFFSALLTLFTLRHEFLAPLGFTQHGIHWNSYVSAIVQTINPICIKTCIIALLASLHILKFDALQY